VSGPTPKPASWPSASPVDGAAVQVDSTSVTWASCVVRGIRQGEDLILRWPHRSQLPPVSNPIRRISMVANQEAGDLP
jgi:hypothetical protein